MCVPHSTICLCGSLGYERQSVLRIGSARKRALARVLVLDETAEKVVEA